MKKYDPDIREGIHTVKITLQQWEYKGHIIMYIGGNCKGKTLLDFDFEYEIDFPNNDCEMKYDEDYDCFSCILKDENGNTLECCGDAEDMNNMIVAVEIIDFREERKE